MNDHTRTEFHVGIKGDVRLKQAVRAQHDTFREDAIGENHRAVAHLRVLAQNHVWADVNAFAELDAGGDAGGGINPGCVNSGSWKMAMTLAKASRQFSTRISVLELVAAPGRTRITPAVLANASSQLLALSAKVTSFAPARAMGATPDTSTSPSPSMEPRKCSASAPRAVISCAVCLSVGGNMRRRARNCNYYGKICSGPAACQESKSKAFAGTNFRLPSCRSRRVLA